MRATIRDATEDDIPALLVMAEKFVRRAWSHVDVPYCAATSGTLLRNLITSETGILLVDEDVTAMFGGLVYPWHFNVNVLTGQELFWWSESRVGVDLLRAGEQRARDLGAKTFNMACMDHMGCDALSRFYEKRGYRPNEHVFIKEFG